MTLRVTYVTFFNNVEIWNVRCTIGNFYLLRDLTRIEQPCLVSIYMFVVYT